MDNQRSNVLGRLRFRQIRFVSKTIETMGTKPRYAAFLRVLRSNPVTRPLLEFALGFRRRFDSLSEARRVADTFTTWGHEHPTNVARHVEALESLRESDYPVLYYWLQIRPEPRRVLDLGGNVGNLFYAYHRHLRFPCDLKWDIVELPNVREAGERLAIERKENRIRYIDALRCAAEEVDLFLSSGSLQYFDESLPDLLLQLRQLPTHVIINRVPVCNGKEVCTVQDGWTYLVPCKIQNVEALVSGMARIGYDLVENWEANEMRQLVPLYPESSAFRYSGFYFRRRSIEFNQTTSPASISRRMVQ